MPEFEPAPGASAPAPSATPAANPPPIPQNSPGFPIPEKIADQTAQLHTSPDLSPKQLSALNRLFAGDDERFICSTLKIDRKTLYNWKTHHPAFRAELARRNHEVWTGVLAEVRSTVIDAVSTLRRHLCAPTDMTQLRAARTLLTLVNSPRLAPTEPTTVTGVLDLLLRTTHPPTTPAAAPAETPTKTPPTFTDAQRQALLTQLLTESAAIEHESDAAFAARRKSAPVTPPAPPTARAPMQSAPAVDASPTITDTMPQPNRASV